MSFGVVIWLMVLSGVVIGNSQPPPPLQQPLVPCNYIFGDSLVDNGNNNRLVTRVKANYPPYGIDFPQGPTGRFTNNRNSADVLAELLGFRNYVPPFATARYHNFSIGVNYASGAAGIRDETGSELGDRISFNRQLLNHQTTISRVVSLMRNITSAKQYLSKCLYTVTIGSNDYINNYLRTQHYPTRRIYNPEQYATVLIRQFSQQLRKLYTYGARKIAIFGIGQLGCTPAEVADLGLMHLDVWMPSIVKFSYSTTNLSHLSMTSIANSLMQNSPLSMLPILTCPILLQLE